MERNPKTTGKLLTLLAVLAPCVSVTACLNIQPKVLGQQGKFDFGAFNTSSSGTFKFNFAYFDSSRSANTIYLQAATNSKSTVIGSCNFTGTGCTCNFLDGAGKTLYTTTSSDISYDDPGNYYRCVYKGASPIANVASVTIQSLDGATTSGPVTVATPATLTLSELIGTDLDINRVRYIYQYSCQYNYLQKSGTTTQGFDCTNAATACEAGDGNAQNNFCLLKATWPFYLYTDTYSSNFSQKPSDKVYNGAGSGSLCGLQIKQYDCVSTGSPQKIFGLYDQLQGIWQTSVQLPAGPDLPAASYGFAAPTSTITGECPPGLVKQVFFTAVVVTSDISPSHNIPSNQVATQVADPSATPTAFGISQYGPPYSGTTGCNGTACGLPLSYNTGFTHSSAYSSTGQTVFCAIPPALLP